MGFEDDRTYEFTAKKEDFPEWFSQVLNAAGIIDNRYELKGFFVWMPYGYKAMMLLKQEWDRLFQENGIREMYFPLIVPFKYAEMNDEWWSGFKTEGYKVVAGEEQEEQGILRPTGEPAMYPMFAMWVRSKNDLPIRIYQTVSSFRYETKQTRPLIRDREITVWHEIHTVHATREEAEQEIKLHERLYDHIWNNIIAIPPFKVNKPKWEVFPGAVGAIEYYNVMPTGRVMENGSINNLGQAYAKKFGIKWGEPGKEEYAWQVCTGNGARLLAAAIAVHGDDKGLVLPPRIAPVQVLVIPVVYKGREEEVMKEARRLVEDLKKTGLRVELDERDITPGRKYYDWEIKGIPLRIEIGPRDIEKGEVVIVRRDTGDKETLRMSDLEKRIPELLDSIHENLHSRAKKMLEESIVECKSLEEIKEAVENGKVARVYWCDDEDCYDEINNLGLGFEGFGTDLYNQEEGECPVCGRKTRTVLYVAKTY